MSDSRTSRSAPSTAVSRAGAVVFGLLAVAGLADCVLAVTELAGATDLAPQLGTTADVVVLVVGAVVVPLAAALARAFARDVRDRSRGAPAGSVPAAAGPQPAGPQPTARGASADPTRIDA